MKEVYQAWDGKIFNSKTQCEEYEKSIVDINGMLEILKITRDICKNFECHNCPLANANRGDCPI